MSFQYAYPHPAVSTDIVTYSVIGGRLCVLLICRNNAPFQGKWALPGGFLNINEDLGTCARRELHEETNLDDIYLEQLYTFGDVERDPRERVITVAYFALVSPNARAHVQAGSDAKKANWFDIRELPELAFDHNEIVAQSTNRLAAKSRYSTILLQLMPDTFTLGELQQVYELVQGEPLDKRNFRKWILSLSCISETGETKRSGNHRPAKLFQATDRKTVEFVK